VLKTSFSVQIDEARQGLREIRSELDAIKQIVAVRRREKAYWDIKYRLAALQFEKALIKHAYACLKGGFRPDQPRWPKRTPQGGRWSGGAGAEPPQTGPSPARFEANSMAIAKNTKTTVAPYERPLTDLNREME
jgi:hypothetical protein